MPRYDEAPVDACLPSVDEVYDSALAEHADLLDYAPERDIREIIGSTLFRIGEFEAAARRPLHVSPETAADIGTIWVLSGPGNYDMPFKPQDNPKLQADKPWLAWFDRARMNQGARLARKVAEIRSGQRIEPASINDLPAQVAESKELIRKYGPYVAYNGYPVETEFAERLLERDGIIVPKDKAHIIHGDLKVTTDQITSFTYPDDVEAQGKEVAIVTHAPHLAARVLHMANRYQPFFDGSVPYVVPVATPQAGRREFAMMEARGQLFYMLKKGDAARDPHPYQFVR